jgi:hypothetical protein
MAKRRLDAEYWRGRFEEIEAQLRRLRVASQRLFAITGSATDHTSLEFARSLLAAEMDRADALTRIKPREDSSTR